MNKSSQLSQDKPGGNTITPGPDTRTISKYQCYLWMITLKSDGETTASQLSQELKGFCKKFTFQKEKGESTGYEHWQIFISLKTKEYFGTVKNLFPSDAHIEPCKNGWKAEQYCKKSDTRIEGPYNEKSTFLKTIDNLYEWQEKLKNILVKDCDDDRVIHWYWDKEGCKGKTAFCKYMLIHHDATIIGNGAMKDIAYVIDNPKIVLMNITRSSEEHINYGAIESIKDGLIFSAKYESKTKVFNSPHVVVLANFEPKKDMLSKDRWNIVKLS